MTYNKNGKEKPILKKKNSVCPRTRIEHKNMGFMREQPQMSMNKDSKRE